MEGDLVWSPTIGWSLGATIAVVAQAGQQHAVDLSEAFLSYRGDPIGRLRLSGRLGLFWPPVSMEHSGPEWAVTDTITPSALNSWIGEEVKTAATEASAALNFGGGRHLTGTLAVFGLNDTSGTLLAFRGWALHDEKATAFGRQPLPPLNGFMTAAQASFTSPVVELDDRPGYYARLGWSSPEFTLHAFHYDNRGDPQAVDAARQWGWHTRFDEIGASLTHGATTLKAQALVGRTEMGFHRAGQIWVDTHFRAAYALLIQHVAWGSVSGRIDAFDTDGRGSVLGAAESERGWAGTLALRRPIGVHLTVLGEALHVESRRDVQMRIGLDPAQAQTIVQVAVRLHS